MKGRPWQGGAELPPWASVVCPRGFLLAPDVSREGWGPKEVYYPREAAPYLEALQRERWQQHDIPV